MDETKRLQMCLDNAHKLIDQLRSERNGLMKACRASLHGKESAHEECLKALNNCKRFFSGRPDVATEALQSILKDSEIGSKEHAVAKNALYKMGLI